MFGTNKQLQTASQRCQALSHPKRAAIFGYLAEHPHDGQSDEAALAEAFGLTASVLDYHLAVLRNSGLLSCRGPASIAPRSRTFLIETFTELRSDLEDQLRAGGPGSPDPEKGARELATFDALLAGLTQSQPFPNGEAIRHYVAGLAKATDEENQYEQATLEHRAFVELLAALTNTSHNGPAPNPSH